MFADEVVIVQTSNGFHTCMQNSSHGVLTCHSCGSDLILLTQKKKVILITAHYEKQHSSEAMVQNDSQLIHFTCTWTKRPVLSYADVPHVFLNAVVQRNCKIFIQLGSKQWAT